MIFNDSAKRIFLILFSFLFLYNPLTTENYIKKTSSSLLPVLSFIKTEFLKPPPDELYEFKSYLGSLVTCFHSKEKGLILSKRIDQKKRDDQDVWLIPGMVIGLRHNINQQMESPNKYMVFFSAPAGASVVRMFGGDIGAPLHRGYEWWIVKDQPGLNTISSNLPPGLVLGLKHSQNQSDISIKVLGGDSIVRGKKIEALERMFGGDLGAPKGHGFYWYETTGVGFFDWNLVEKLPKWSVVGLKHSVNQKNKKLIWNGKVYDPADNRIPPPPGFVRKFGGDIGAPKGEGYYWYEKIEGPEIVVKPSLKVKLPQNLIIGSDSEAVSIEVDADRDSLIDRYENVLAETFRPYCIFDSAEKARFEYEPVGLFQVRPLDLCDNSYLQILIKWIFLFRQDGGYGPNSSVFCRDSHEGDNDDAIFELVSRDGGLTWQVVRAKLSFKGMEWPSNSRLEVYDLTHPIIYMSAHKHHEYFTRDYDHRDSLYSAYGCNDDVNGEGARILVNLKSIDNSKFNNVGEPEFHPSSVFINKLDKYYPGHSAWETNKFYSCDPLGEKWMYHLQKCGRYLEGRLIFLTNPEFKIPPSPPCFFKFKVTQTPASIYFRLEPTDNPCYFEVVEWKSTPQEFEEIFAASNPQCCSPTTLGERHIRFIYATKRAGPFLTISPDEKVRDRYKLKTFVDFKRDMERPFFFALEFLERGYSKCGEYQVNPLDEKWYPLHNNNWPLIDGYRETFGKYTYKLQICNQHVERIKEKCQENKK